MPVLIVALALLTACGSAEEPGLSNADYASVANGHNKALMHIETSLVSAGPANVTLFLTGKVAYREDHHSKISSPVQGRVVEVRARLGDQVNAGDILLVLESPHVAKAYSEFVREHSELGHATQAYRLAHDLFKAKALPLLDLKQAEKDLAKAQAEFRRTKERLLALQVPAVEVNKPLSDQTISARFELRSPLTGTVVERTVTPGQLVTGHSSQALFMVADLDRLQIVADAFERDLAMIRPGQDATVTVDAYPDMVFPAVVETIGDIVDSSSRTIKVRAWFNNDHPKLKPEMFTRLYLSLDNDGTFFSVPNKAVLVVDGKEYVYVMEAEGRYVRRAVKVGPASGDLIRVVEGLTFGDRVVTKGAVLLMAQEGTG